MQRPDSKSWRVSAYLPSFMFACVIAAIVGSGVWVYNASATTFRLQTDIRVAQETRDRIVRAHLATKSDVQAFAATGDASFAQRYTRHTQSLLRYTVKLKGELRQIDTAFDTTPLTQEETLFHIWQQRVAAPIFSRHAVSVRNLLVSVDPELSRRFLSEDMKIQHFLDLAVSAAEKRRARFLRRLIFWRAITVVLGISFIGILFWLRERTKRKQLLHAAEFHEQQRLADMLQKSLVPDVLPEIAGVSLQAVYIPAALEASVGGDWYEIIELSAGRLFCIIGDVAGHGLDAAIVMNRARQSIIAAAIVEDDPAQILCRANTALMKFAGRMVTVLCCILDTRSRHFVYASAGHPPPVLVAPVQTAMLLHYDGPPLGVFPSLMLQTHACTLAVGSSVFLFTDGLIENDYAILQGEERLLEGAEYATSANQPAAALYTYVIGAALTKDDLAVLAIQLL